MNEAMCPICGKPANAPWRELNTSAEGGGIRFGCIAAFHNEAMAHDAWHNRKEAKDARKATAAYERSWRK